MKYGIRLYSKYTGETITLGVQYHSQEEAKKDAEKTCQRCNSYSIIPIGDDAFWVDKTIGFLSGKRLEEYADQQRQKQKARLTPRP